MFTVVVQLLGWVAFVGAVAVLGMWLRRNPSKAGAERASRALHLLFWVGLVAPAGLGALYPGLTRFDDLLGLRSLPRHALLVAAGVAAVVAGLYLLIASNVALRIYGEGANAFVLTKKVVVGNIYDRTRNPMSLGYYLAALGIGLLAGSTYVTAGTLLGLVPGHLFFLKYFEERELALRLGEPYLAYKARVPFLLPRLGPRREG